MAIIKMMSLRGAELTYFNREKQVRNQSFSFFAGTWREGLWVIQERSICGLISSENVCKGKPGE